jgi:hypothetical protein
MLQDLDIETGVDLATDAFICDAPGCSCLSRVARAVAAGGAR